VIIAQISDMHIKAEGRLAYGRADTESYLARAVQHVMDIAPRPDTCSERATSSTRRGPRSTGGSAQCSRR
jgi:hypothetical protein